MSDEEVTVSIPKQKKPKDRKANLYVPLPNHIWNPLVNLPRNNPCPCGSGKKFKKCHLPKMPRALPRPELPNTNGAKIDPKKPV